MPTKTKILVAFLASFALLGPAAGAQARTLSNSEASLLQTMNSVRTSHGLAPLRLDVRLLRAARGHSADMLNRQYFAHGSVAGRALAHGARGPVFGEDLAWGTSVTAQWVVEPLAREPGSPGRAAPPRFPPSRDRHRFRHLRRARWCRSRHGRFRRALEPSGENRTGGRLGRRPLLRPLSDVPRDDLRDGSSRSVGAGPRTTPVRAHAQRMRSGDRA